MTQPITVAYPVNGVVDLTIFPGGMKDMVASSSPDDVWLATGDVHKIDLNAGAGTIVGIYDYVGVDGRMIMGGTDMGANALISGVNSGGFTTFTVTTDLPDRKSFIADIAAAVPASYNGGHAAIRVTARTFTIKNPPGETATPTPATGTVAVNNTLLGRAAATAAVTGIFTGVNRDGGSEVDIGDPWDAGGGAGALPAGVTAASKVWGVTLPVGRHLLEPDATCPHGMIVTLSGVAITGDCSITYCPRIIGGRRKSILDQAAIRERGASLPIG